MAVEQFPFLPESQISVSFSLQKGNIRIEKEAVRAPGIGKWRVTSICEIPVPVDIGQCAAQRFEIVDRKKLGFESGQVFDKSFFLKISISSTPLIIEEDINGSIDSR